MCLCGEMNSTRDLNQMKIGLFFGSFNPIHIEQQVVTLWAIQKGYYDGLEIKAVTRAAVSLREFFATRKDALLTEIRTKAALDKDLEAKIQAAMEEWKGSYAAKG